MRRAVLAAVLLSLVWAAPAEAWLALAADATHRPGRIGFYVWGSGAFTGVDLAERVDGTDVPLRTVVPPEVRGPGGSVLSGGYYPDVGIWRCDRLTRSFSAVGHRADGTVETAAFDVRTPSCRSRLVLIARDGCIPMRGCACAFGTGSSSAASRPASA